MSNTSGSKIIKDMTMVELKQYLKERGVTVSGYLKPALVEIANAVEKMMLPIVPNFEKHENEEKLIIHDMEIENPFSGSHVVLNNFIDSPPFGLYDIFNYLIYHSTDYDKQGLAAYKSFDDYRLFEEGYVESLLTKTFDNERVHLYVAKVRPAMKEKADEQNKFYDLWFILEGRGANRGSVLKARCICKGGRDGGCKHIAAAMYSLEDLLNSRGENSVTSGPCQWVKKATSNSKPCDVKDLQIHTHCQPSTKKRKKEHVYCEHLNIDVRHEEDRNLPSQKSLELFTASLESVQRKPTIFPSLAKFYKPSDVPTRHCGKVTDIVREGNKVFVFY